VGWGRYYLSTVLDDYSRYILAWRLTTTMQATEVMATLDLARARAGIDQVHVVHRPRLLSDNGPCCVSRALGTYLTQHGLRHPRGAPYHPMTQGKIERYHRSMKNVVKLDVYHSPWELVVGTHACHGASAHSARGCAPLVHCRTPRGGHGLRECVAATAR